MNRSVYVIDDDAVTRQSLRTFLEARGLTVVSATTAAEAMDVLHNDVFPLPSVVITDVRLTGLSGVSLARHIRSTPRFRDVAVMLISAYDPPAQLPGAVRFFQKPLNWDAIGDYLSLVPGMKAVATARAMRR